MSRRRLQVRPVKGPWWCYRGNHHLEHIDSLSKTSVRTRPFVTGIVGGLQNSLVPTPGVTSTGRRWWRTHTRTWGDGNEVVSTKRPWGITLQQPSSSSCRTGEVTSSKNYSVPVPCFETRTKVEGSQSCPVGTHDSTRNRGIITGLHFGQLC